jgi:lysophospholipase L1-like esterase
MKNAWAWVAAAAVLFLAAGRGVVAALDDVVERRTKPRSILIVGDSHTAGAGTLGAWLQVALENAGIPTTKAGVNGASVWWWLQENRLVDVIASDPPPELVIVELGGGDAARRVTQGHYNAQLRQFVEKLRAAGVEDVIWLSPTKDEVAGGNDQRRQKVAEWQALKLPEFGVQVLEQRSHTDSIPTTDGIHYSQDGYLTWSDRLVGPTGPLYWLVA